MLTGCMTGPTTLLTPPHPNPPIIFILTLMMKMKKMMMMITAEMFTQHPKATQGNLTKVMNHHLNDTHEAQGVRRIRCKYHASCADVFEISSEKVQFCTFGFQPVGINI